jgi:hypothetical protein
VKARTKGAHPTVRRDDYGFTLAKVPERETQLRPDSFAFSINVQQVLFLDEGRDREWEVVCRVDVRSRHSPLQFATDDSIILNVERNEDFEGLNTDYGNYNFIPREIPPPETIYLLEMSPHRQKADTAETDEEGRLAGDSSESEGENR